MAIVCQECGVVGYEELLVYCCLCCKAAAVHQYCLETIPKFGEDIQWSCEGCKNVANLHAREDNEPRTWKKTNRRSIRSRKYTWEACPTSLRDEATCSNPFEYFKPSGRRRKLILPDGDDDLIDDTSIDSLLEGEIDILGKKVILYRSLEENKHNDHGRKLALSDEENKDNNLKAKEALISLKNNKMKDFEVKPTLEKTFNEMTTKTKSDNDLMRWSTLCVKGHEQLKDCAFNYMLARPISWRGWFKIFGRAYGPLIAHLSPKAGEKAWNATRFLPQIIQLTIISRSHAWPRSFECSPPTDDHIALFFFPPDTRVEKMVDQLVEEVMRCDLMLKVVLDEVELLIFPSNLLPVNYKRWYQDKYYLWGVFKRKDSNTNTGDITLPRTNENSTKKSVHNASEGAQIESVNKEMFLEGDEPPESLCHLTDEGEVKEMGNDWGKDEELTECLELFPIQAENIGLILKMGDGKKAVDAELRLGLPFRQ